MEGFNVLSNSVSGAELNTLAGVVDKEKKKRISVLKVRTELQELKEVVSRIFYELHDFAHRLKQLENRQP
jgi:hypothetical protein